MTPKGKAIVRVIASNPDKPLSLMYVTLISAITHAQRSVHLTMAYVGSTNLDWRSFAYNNEINAVVLGTELGEAMEAMFAKDLADSARIDPEQWRKRPFSMRVREWIARLWEQWL